MLVPLILILAQSDILVPTLILVVSSLDSHSEERSQIFEKGFAIRCWPIMLDWDQIPNLQSSG